MTFSYFFLLFFAIFIPLQLLLHRAETISFNRLINDILNELKWEKSSGRSYVLKLNWFFIQFFLRRIKINKFFKIRSCESPNRSSGSEKLSAELLKIYNRFFMSDQTIWIKDSFIFLSNIFRLIQHKIDSKCIRKRYKCYTIVSQKENFRRKKIRHCNAM